MPETLNLPWDLQHRHQEIMWERLPLWHRKAAVSMNLQEPIIFSLILAYHAQGEVIYWRYLDYEPADSRRIAEYFGEVSGYRVEETPSTSGYAGFKDWFIQEYNRPGYTIEVGMGVSPLPMSQFAGIYEDNRLILEGGMTELVR